MRLREVAITVPAQVASQELSAGATARLLGIPPHTVWWWINHRGLPAGRRNPRGAYVIRVDDLRAWVEREKPCFRERVEEDDEKAAAALVSEAEYARRWQAVRAMLDRWGLPYPVAVQE